MGFKNCRFKPGLEKVVIAVILRPPTTKAYEEPRSANPQPLFYFPLRTRSLYGRPF